MRLRPLLQLALFLCAGTSLPSLDAILYHGRAAERFAGDTHLDPAGGCGGHDDHCTLGRTAPGSGSVRPHALLVRIDIDPDRSTVRAPESPASTPSRGTLPQPRAPPAPAA
jgi:hypothetical protein